MTGDHVFDAAHIHLDIDFEIEDLIAGAVKDERVGLSVFHPAEYDALRRLHDGIGDVRIGNHHVRRRRPKIDNGRFVQSERDPLAESRLTWLGDLRIEPARPGNGDRRRQQRQNKQSCQSVCQEGLHTQLPPRPAVARPFR